MTGVGSFIRLATSLLAAVTLAACADDELSRGELCEMDCAQKFSCDHAPMFATLFGDEATCVDVCTNWELPAGCLDGIPDKCVSARRDRWECVASLSCDELDFFLRETPTSSWEMVENEDGSITWVSMAGDYPCESHDQEVSNACDGVDWAGFEEECGYDGGYVVANCYDGEFDDM